MGGWGIAVVGGGAFNCADARCAFAVCGGCSVGLYFEPAGGKALPTQGAACDGGDAGDGVCVAAAGVAAVDCGADVGAAIWQFAG